MERLKFFMKEETIRHDIIQAAANSFNLDHIGVIFGKAKSLNKIFAAFVFFGCVYIYILKIHILHELLF